MSAITAATAVLIPLLPAPGTLPPSTLSPAILNLPYLAPLNLATLGAHDASPLLACLENGVLAWGLAACGLAQLSKLAIELVLHRRWRPAVGL